MFKSLKLRSVTDLSLSRNGTVLVLWVLDKENINLVYYTATDDPTQGRVGPGRLSRKSGGQRGVEG